jgi:hypothetical protein
MPQETVSEILKMAPDILTKCLAEGVSLKSVNAVCAELEAEATRSIDGRLRVFEALTWLLDRLHLIPYANNGMVRASVESSLFNVLRAFPQLSDTAPMKWSLLPSANKLRPPKGAEEILLTDVSSLSAEGEGSASTLVVAAYKAGWKHVVSFDWRGQRFCGSGLGERSDGFRLDVYGNPGDYLRRTLARAAVPFPPRGGTV